MLLALADLRFARGRFVLVGAVIALVALMATLLSGLANGLVDDGISGLRRLPLTHLAFQPGADSTFSRSTLTPENLEPWRDHRGVDVSPIGVSFLNAQPDRGQAVDFALFGVPPDSFLVPAGAAHASLVGRPGLILGDELRDQGIEVGDELTVVGADVRLPVLGFTYAGTYGHVDIAFTSLATWQQIVYGDNARGRFSAIAIKADDTSGFRAIDRTARTETVTKTQAYQGSPGYTGETQTMTLIRAFLLIISALIVGAFFTVWTVQRARQIGLLKALGASNAYVLRDALGQLGIVLLAATIVGALVGVGLGQLVTGDVPFRLVPRDVGLVAGLLVLLGLIGSTVAIRRITSVDPIVALRSEA